MKNNELKPCPFCGGVPTIKRYNENFIVECRHHEWSKPDKDGIRIAGDICICADMRGKYNFETGEYEYSPDEIEQCTNAAIKAWNTRTEGANDAD